MQYMEVNILMSIVTPPAETDVVLPATMSSVIFSKNAFLTEKGRGGEFHHVVPDYKKWSEQPGWLHNVAQAYDPFPRMLN